MQILDIKALDGPNVWSIEYPQLIVLKIVLQKNDYFTSENVDYFTKSFCELFPSFAKTKGLNENNENIQEGFKIGTPLSHLVPLVAQELQRLAGMTCNFAQSSTSNKKDIYYAIFSYEVANAGIYAAEATVKIVQTLAGSKTYSFLKKDIMKLRDILSEEGLGPSTKSIVNEAQKRDIPYRRIGTGSLVMLGYGKELKLVNATATSDTSIVGVDLVSEKDFTKKILAASYIPVPNGLVIRNLKQLKEAMEKIHFPIVIKPLDGNHGRGVTTHITTKEKAYAAYKLARKISPNIIVEHFINGFDYRFLVINYKLAAAAKRKPASIIGDGVSTIKALIDKVNNDPRRGNQHENTLTKIKIDDMTLEILESQALTLDSILPSDKELFLKYSANISMGGTAIDVTSEVHPDNFYIAERIARLLNLNICGVDIIAENISQPLHEDNGAIIEVNASPGIRMHLSPQEGKPRNVAKNIVDMLYPIGVNPRIPIIAVTGTNGKTTTVRLIENFAAHEGYNVGFTTTDGIYIKNKLIYKGDCSGPVSARSVLRDPVVDFAVFECARGGILDSGLGFDKCNISIVTNITSDHLGLKDIDTLEDLARVKKVVPKSTISNGFAILNADDDLVYSMKDELTCNVALFSMKHDNIRIDEHCGNGGIAIYLKKDNIILRRGDLKQIFVNVNDIPLTHFGTATAMIQDILAASLACFLCKFDLLHMEKLLKNFHPTSENLPGRMNLFDFNNFKVLVDYGHNVGAFVELKKYLDQIKSREKIGVIGAPGDRRNEDIVNIGYYSAQIFDKIIIKHDKYGRGRSNQEITSLIKNGIQKYNPNCNVNVISDEQKALEFAIKEVKSEGFIVFFPEDVSSAIDYLKRTHPS